MKPLLDLKNHPHGLADIFKKFEAGKPLSSDQLNFITSHARALSNSTLDPVLRYYLKEHQLRPDKALPLTLSEKNLSAPGFQQVKQNIHLLLRNNLTHVDLQMTPEQFQHFKKMGGEELQFWHGEYCLPSSLFYHSGLPYRVYFQWGRLFGVVKFQLLSCGKRVEGKVLIFLEDRHEKSLHECIQAYTHKRKDEERLENQRIQSPFLEPLVEQFKLPTPTLGFQGMKPEQRD